MKGPFVNSGRSVRLSSLILSGELDDNALICVYDAEGKFLGRGGWFSDFVLRWYDRYGVAVKPGTGRSINFRFDPA